MERWRCANRIMSGRSLVQEMQEHIREMYACVLLEIAKHLRQPLCCCHALVRLGCVWLQRCVRVVKVELSLPWIHPIISTTAFNNMCKLNSWPQVPVTIYFVHASCLRLWLAWSTQNHRVYEARCALHFQLQSKAREPEADAHCYCFKMNEHTRG